MDCPKNQLFKTCFSWVRSYKLNNWIKINTDSIETDPPISPAKNFVKKFKQILDTRLPNKEQGREVSIYLISNLKYLNLKSGIAFLIFDKLSKVIVDIERKNETITELIPINGVKIIKLDSNITEPIM